MSVFGAGMQLVHKRSSAYPAGDDPPRGPRPAALHDLAARPQAAGRLQLERQQRRRRRRLLGRGRS